MVEKLLRQVEKLLRQVKVCLQHWRFVRDYDRNGGTAPPQDARGTRHRGCVG